MKSLFYIYKRRFLLLLVISFLSCSRDKDNDPARYEFPSQNSFQRIQPSFQDSLVDHFDSLIWRKTDIGCELNLTSNRLTQRAINSGIEVYLSQNEYWDDFYLLPYGDQGLYFYYKAGDYYLDIIAERASGITSISKVQLVYK